MANYNSIKNAALIAPTTNPDLGSATNRYGNVYLSGNVNIAGTSLTSTNALAPRITSINYIGDDTAADIAGGQTITLSGSGYQTGATVLINGTPVSLVTFVNSTTLTFTSPAMSAGGYVVYVINPDGGTALSVPGIQYSGVPAWTTSAGSLASVVKSSSVNITVAATGDAPVTYSVTSGALPSGVTLNASTGFISGTAPTVTNSSTYNFTISAIDAQKQDTARNFSLTVIPSNAPATVEYLVVAGGGGGGGIGGGGGAGGYLTATSYSITPSTPITVTVGAGGAASTDSYAVNGGNGGASVFGTITSTGGGGGAAGSGGAPVIQAGSGGSGGGGAGVAFGGNGTGGAGIAGQGYAGGTSTAYGRGGGGGAGAAGTGGASGGPGGVGLSSSISGAATYYAGGGGGGNYNTTVNYAPGAGGTGGGGRGGLDGATATSGTPNTGGGGGAGAYNGSGYAYPAGAGGSGIVIIRYSDTYDAAPSTTGSPTITVAGGYRVYKWTTSGTITF